MRARLVSVIVLATILLLIISLGTGILRTGAQGPEPDKPLPVSTPILALPQSEYSQTLPQSLDSNEQVGLDSQSTTCGGCTIDSWRATTSLPQPMGVPFVGAGRQLVISNGRMYVFGGRDNSGNALTSVYYSTIQASGLLGSWISTTSLPGQYYDQAVVQVGNYVYLITGAASATAVYYAPINSDGSIGGWVQTASLNPSRQSFAAVAYREYIYASGGNAVGTQDFVKFTSVKPDGSLNPWADTTSLPAPMEGHTMVAYNGRLYVFAPNRAVYYASINPNGTLGSWAATTSLPQAMMFYSTFEYNGYIYLLGGSSQAVYCVSILGDGSLGQWQVTTSLPGQRSRLWVGGYNCFMYAVGGYDGSNYRDAVYYAQLLSPVTNTPTPTSTSTATPTNTPTPTPTRLARVYLPIIVRTSSSPPPRSIQNPSFEDGLSYWQTVGVVAPSLDWQTNGQYSARLGDPNYSCAGGGVVGKNGVTQSFDVPYAGSTTLAFDYKIVTEDSLLLNGDYLQIEINGSPVQRIGWQQAASRCLGQPNIFTGTYSVDLLGLRHPRGTSITLGVFIVIVDKYYNTYGYIDNVRWGP